MRSLSLKVDPMIGQSITQALEDSLFVVEVLQLACVEFNCNGSLWFVYQKGRAIEYPSVGGGNYEWNRDELGGWVKGRFNPPLTPFEVKPE